MSYFNQKLIKVNREIPSEKKNTNRVFVSAYNDVIEEASKELNGNAFKFYIYLLMNKDGHKLYYSPEHFKKTFGVGLTSAKSVFDELENSGYILKMSDGSYEFNERKKDKQIEIQKEKRGFKQSNGNVIWLTYSELLYKVNGGNIAETNIDWNSGIKE